MPCRPVTNKAFAQLGKIAVTSISILYFGSINPHSIIVAAGGVSPNVLDRIGQQASKSAAVGNM